MLTFYYVPNTCALASHIALEEAGADYTGVRMNFADEDQKKPDYLAINPKARVPALVTARGVLTETPAILVYLCQQYPGANMAPVDDPLNWPAFSPSTPTSAPRCTWPMPIAGAANVGPMIRRPLPPCATRYRNRSASVSA